MRTRFSNFIWGIVLLLTAGFILLNQFNGFADIGAGSIILAVLALLFLVQCIADLQFGALPIPLAVLYIVFQRSLNLPYMRPWTLIVAAVLATVGLGVLFPGRHLRFGIFRPGRHGNKHCSRPVDEVQPHVEYGGNDNNVSVSVNFGAVSRHLRADRLETAQLYCNFGALEINFNQVELSPNGAEAVVHCSFGAIKLYIPKHWHLVTRVNCTLGGVDTDKNFAVPAENAPQLTLTGSVSLGGIEVRYI